MLLLRSFITKFKIVTQNALIVLAKLVIVLTYLYIFTTVFRKQFSIKGVGNDLFEINKRLLYCP